MRSRQSVALAVGLTLIVLTGIIHFVDTPDAFAEATYKGLLFLANGVGALIAAGAILTGRRWGWSLGALVAAGAFVGYVLSRTVGMPGLPAEPDAWLEPLGAISLLAEGLFVALAARMLVSAAQPAERMARVER